MNEQPRPDGDDVVAALTLENLVRAARTLGVDVDALFTGSALSPHALVDGRTWVAWRDAVVVVQRLVAAVDDERLDQLVSRHMHTHPVHRVLATFSSTATAWLRVCWRVTGALAPVMDVRLDVDDDEHQLSCALRAGRAPSAAWFTLLQRCAVHAPAPVSSARLSLSSVERDDTRLVARWRAPVERAPASRRRSPAGPSLSTMLSSLPLLLPAVGALADGHLAGSPDLSAHVDEVASLAARFSLAPSEARAALLLADGARTVEIASTLGIRAETVRGYLKRAYGKTETSGQRELVDVIRAWRLR